MHRIPGHSEYSTRRVCTVRNYEINCVYWLNTYETFQAASALWLKFSLYACMGAVCPSACRDRKW